MAKTLKDILNGVKASKVVPGSTGKDPGVDYAPKAPNDQEFVKLHKTEKHSDRVGNTDELYQATNIKHSQVAEPKHGYKKPEDKSVNEAAKCNMTEEGVSCPVHEMADCSTPKKTLKEVLTKKTSAGEIIKDFRKSKDPKFAGKSGEERQRMALGAYYSMHPEKSKKTNEEVEPINEVNHREYGAKGKMHPDMAKGMDVGMHTDFYQHGTGDKGYGMVTKNDGKSVHVRSKARTGTLGKIHKFTVTPHLGEETEGFNSGALHGVGSTEIEQIDEISKELYDRHPEIFTRVIHKNKFIGAVIKHRDGSAESRRFKTPKSVDSPPTGTTMVMKHKSKDDAVNHLMKRAKEQLGEDLAVPLLGGSDDDESAEMAKTQLRALANKALHLAMKLGDEQIIEPWVQAKIAVAKDHVNAVHDYMVYGDHSKDKENEQTAPYVGGVDMTGSPRNTFPSYSVDVNTGRNV